MITISLIAKILIMTIQANLCCLLHVLLGFSTKFPEFSFLKFVLLIYHHSHFLAATLDFMSFFTMAFLGATHFFYSSAVFGLDFTFFVTLHCKTGILTLMVFITCPFYLYVDRYIYAVLYMCKSKH